jgi:hypothetical protein
VGGLLTSEVWLGWATERDLQPNIDGLSFDEVLLFDLVSGVVAVLVTRYVTRGHGGHPCELRTNAARTTYPGSGPPEQADAGLPGSGPHTALLPRSAQVREPGPHVLDVRQRFGCVRTRERVLTGWVALT